MPRHKTRKEPSVIELRCIPLRCRERERDGDAAWPGSKCLTLLEKSSCADVSSRKRGLSMRSRSLYNYTDIQTLVYADL